MNKQLLLDETCHRVYAVLVFEDGYEVDVHAVFKTLDGAEQKAEDLLKNTDAFKYDYEVIVKPCLLRD